MTVQSNPFFYGRPVSREEDLADREADKTLLRSDVLSGQPVMIYAPRRYGKTSLARVVAERLQEGDGVPYVYADLWGARSVTDVVETLGEAYSRVSGISRVRRWLAELLRGIGFEVKVGGVLSVRYEGYATDKSEDSERRALRELLRVPERMAERSPSGRLLLVLDEFGELNNVPGEPDAPMRAAFQDSPNVSFVFLGSKKSLMDGLFSDRRRPFYNFGRRMTLGPLAYEELGRFVEERFGAAGVEITSGAVDTLLDLTGGHPYRAQQIAYHAFELASRGAGGADEETVLAAREAAMEEGAAEFRAILEGMTPSQRALYVALCREPTAELYSRPYMRRHGIRSPGSLSSALRTLTDAGESEAEASGRPKPTDPLFASWVRERMGRPL